MKVRISKTLLPAVGMLIPAALPCAAQSAIVPAPPATQAQPEGSSPRKWRQQIQLRSIKPGLMAFWLDPTHNSWRPEFGQRALSQLEQLPQKFRLPEGVDQIVPVDPQNALLVFGTEAGVRQLRDIVAVLDRPQRQIELQARILSMPISEMTRFWADLSTQSNQNPPVPNLLSDAEENGVGELIFAQKARIESVRRAVVDEEASQTLDFGPPARPNPWLGDYLAPMPVIPPPGDYNMRNLRPAEPTRIPPAPAPFGRMKLQITPTLTKEGISLQTLTLISGEDGSSGTPTSFLTALRAGQTLAVALPIAAPDRRAFLLLSADLVPVAQGARIPIIGDLPLIGGLFRSRKAPQPAP